MKSILFILSILIYWKFTSATSWDIRTFLNSTNDAGEPLFLTKLIENGSIAEAQEKARFRHPILEGIESYSGFITVNKTYNSNTFFWFFPSQSNPKDDPVILWFIGGPGLSVFTTIFLYHGPLKFSSLYTVETRSDTLTKNHSVIYIDNPIGTGFSFTENDEGYARDQGDVNRHVISFLNQFFQLFPQYQRNDFYTGGDSYGGAFVLLVADAIRKSNEQNQSQINFQGTMTGNGYIDIIQNLHSDFIFTIGLVDERGRDEMRAYELGIKPLTRIEVIMKNLTGFDHILNLYYEEYDYLVYYLIWILTPDFRSAAHVGNVVYNVSSDIVRDFYRQEFVMKPLLEDLLRHNYRALVYNGQLDMYFPYTSSLLVYETLNWTGVEAYKESERKQWWVDGELAGYVQEAGNFHEVLVRSAGHVTFYEQPKWTCELFTRFTHRRPIAQGQPATFPFQTRYDIPPFII